MKEPRSSSTYGIGVTNFLLYAAENAGMQDRVLCPCAHCPNRFWKTNSIVSEHLICNGFMHGYHTWVFHGEDSVQPLVPHLSP